MSSLEKYVEKVKKETEGFSNIEKLRYIYWDLGSKFAFDLDILTTLKRIYLKEARLKVTKQIKHYYNR